MTDYKVYQLITPQGRLTLGREPLIMGILNVTPDSFSDGGSFLEIDSAVNHAMEMARDGAAIIDIGGESTRPGSLAVDAAEQIQRVVPVIRAIREQSEIPISIDTTWAEVAAAALEAGASMVNDISALTGDTALGPLVAERNVPIVLMHMQGIPRTMQQAPEYEDVVDDIIDWLKERIDYAITCGIDRGQIVVDPGIGFGKTLEHNLTLMQNLERFHELGVPLLVGTSRKSFIGKVLDIDDPRERIWGTAATVSRCMMAGMHILRVHDVKPMAQVAGMTRAMMKY